MCSYARSAQVREIFNISHPKVFTLMSFLKAEHTILITETGADILTDRRTAEETFARYKP